MGDRLERLRDRAHAQMVQILQFGENITVDTTIEAINTRLETLEARYQTFNELELQLFENPTYKTITKEVDETYYKARELLEQACGRRGRGGVNPNRDLNTTLEQFFEQQKTFYEGVNTSQNVRLPKINIEPFSGDYKHWASFHDLFKTTVHDNHSISDVNKLQRLKVLLKDEAAALIRHTPIIESNYAEAWEKLCKRYNKMTPIVATLVQSFMEQKPCIQGNGKELRRIAETSDEIIRGLRVLGPNAETRDPFLIHILLGKIDDETKQLWANESVDKDFPTFENLLSFLNKRCDALEICGSTNKKMTTRLSTKSFVSTQPNPTFYCVVCKQQHPTFKCPEFKNMNVETRSKFVSENNLCGNCLKKGHTSTKCFSRASCIICKNRHHTLLHQGQKEIHGSNQVSTNHHITVDQSPEDRLSQSSYIRPSRSYQSSKTEEPQMSNNQINAVLHTQYSSISTLLPTAVINIQSRNGDLQPYRALLDSGSQTSFVTESCAQSLGLKRSQSSVSIYGLASTPTGKTREQIDMTIYSRTDRTYQITVTAHIINNITTLLPTKPVNVKNTTIQLQLADSQFYKPNKIDVLLGADVFFAILNPERREIDGLPTLQSSKLGWLVAGAWHNSMASLTNLHIITDPVLEITNEGLHREEEKISEVEQIPSHTNPVTNTYECDLTIARRENPQEIWCDNGSTFIRARRELQQIMQQITTKMNNVIISDFPLQKGINFRVNPPHAPRFGGLCESIVKSLKYHMKRVTNIYPMFKKMTTLIIQTESLLNSRSCCRLNDDRANLQILTPAHIQHRSQGLWKRWYRDYLTSLQRAKWKYKTEQFKANDVVHISEDNLFPSQWVFVRGTAIHPEWQHHTSNNIKNNP